LQPKTGLLHNVEKLSVEYCRKYTHIYSAKIVKNNFSWMLLLSAV